MIYVPVFLHWDFFIKNFKKSIVISNKRFTFDILITIKNTNHETRNKKRTYNFSSYITGYAYLLCRFYSITIKTKP